MTCVPCCCSPCNTTTVIDRDAGSDVNRGRTEASRGHFFTPTVLRMADSLTEKSSCSVPAAAPAAHGRIGSAKHAHNPSACTPSNERRLCSRRQSVDRQRRGGTDSHPPMRTAHASMGEDAGRRYVRLASLQVAILLEAASPVGRRWLRQLPVSNETVKTNKSFSVSIALRMPGDSSSICSMRAVPRQLPPRRILPA